MRRDTHGKIRGFTASDHTETTVCAAVSLLMQNTLNALEMFTDVGFACDFEPKGGHMTVALTDDFSEKADLLLETMALGLHSVAAGYEDTIVIKEETLHDTH